MNQKPQTADAAGTDARAKASHRLRVALLLSATGAVGTALLAAIGPKLPPYFGD
jgi:hypothetical protein